MKWTGAMESAFFLPHQLGFIVEEDLRQFSAEPSLPAHSASREGQVSFQKTKPLLFIALGLLEKDCQ